MFRGLLRYALINLRNERGTHSTLASNSVTRETSHTRREFSGGTLLVQCTLQKGITKQHVITGYHVFCIIPRYRVICSHEQPCLKRSDCVFRNIKSIPECLADEIMNCAKV